MDMPAETKTSTAPASKPDGTSRRAIRNELRRILKETEIGVAVQAFGHRIVWARRFHKGTRGRWSPILVLTRTKSRKVMGDAIVLSADDAADYLFPRLNPAATPA